MNASATEQLSEKYLTWTRAKRMVGFVLLFIVAVNFGLWYSRTMDQHHPIASQKEFISNVIMRLWFFAVPYLETPIDILLGISWVVLGTVLPLFAAAFGLGGFFWALLSPYASRK